VTEDKYVYHVRRMKQFCYTRNVIRLQCYPVLQHVRANNATVVRNELFLFRSIIVPKKLFRKFPVPRFMSPSYELVSGPSSKPLVTRDQKKNNPAQLTLLTYATVKINLKFLPSICWYPQHYITTFGAMLQERKWRNNLLQQLRRMLVLSSIQLR
jgi:hypothetical protein